jgi:hypothetical protein
MAIRKTTRPRTSAPVSPVTSPARPRRPGAPRRARRSSDDAPAALTIAPPTEEEIRTRAYYLSLERRGRAADPLADWLRAEQELVAARAVVPGVEASGAA